MLGTSERGQLEEGPGWFRRSRRYSPFYRSPGLRRLPDEGIGPAFICSLILHAALIVALIRFTDAPPLPVGADTSLLSLVDLVGSPPGGTQRIQADPKRVASVKHSEPRRATSSSLLAQRARSATTPQASKPAELVKGVGGAALAGGGRAGALAARRGPRIHPRAGQPGRRSVGRAAFRDRRGNATGRRVARATIIRSSASTGCGAGTGADSSCGDCRLASPVGALEPGCRCKAGA